MPLYWIPGVFTDLERPEESLQPPSMGGAWYQYVIYTCQKGYHHMHFKANRGTNLGGLIPTTLFDLVVKNVARNWLSLMVEDQLVAHKGLVLAVGRCLRLFYADNVVVGLRDLE